MPVPPIPTRLSNVSPPASAQQTTRTIVAGTTAGTIALVFLVIVAYLFFFRVRYQRRQQNLDEAPTTEERKTNGAGGVGMLDGLDFHAVSPVLPPRIEYRPSFEYHLALPFAEEPPPTAPPPRTPFLFSGSALWEEVWPPPRAESVFVDPLLHAPVAALADNIARITTDIMGQPSEGDADEGPLAPPKPHWEPPPPPSAACACGSACLPAVFPSLPCTRSPLGSASMAGPLPIATTLRSSASTPTLPRSESMASAQSRPTTASDDDPPWPPTPGGLSVLERAPPLVPYPAITIAIPKDVRLSPNEKERGKRTGKQGGGVADAKPLCDGSDAAAIFRLTRASIDESIKNSEPHLYG
ncbi:hypothetical protein GGX14DRAFT_408914 [Mycena pura]|uniref:Uncharacterized protein n=1 Tax=Mycena pura TaxID=153505 RepID=A0AAD6ULX8_9AGAR|nr:hypothetical protein GGX14DRAFT_408914 [Mycena pura]